MKAKKEESIEISVYPNPNNGTFTIQLENTTENNSIEIYSVLGQSVFTKANTKETIIDISNLEKGIYFIKINQQNTTITKKVIVNYSDDTTAHLLAVFWSVDLFRVSV